MRSRRRKSSSRRSRRARALLRASAAIVLGVVLLTALPVLALRFVAPPTTAFMLLDRGDTLDYEWHDWPRLGTSAALAVIAAEDQKFPDHFGFDVQSIRRALTANASRERPRGASTISQQTAKNLFLWPTQSYFRKSIEAYFTVLIELAWPKRRILEVYLNIAEFGPGIYGVGAASRVYFGKTPERLDDAEAALLAAVLPNPKRYRVELPSSYLRERQAWILTQMRRLRRDGTLMLIAG